MTLISEPKGDFAVTALELQSENPRVHIGANNPPEETPFEKVEREISDLYDEALQWLDGEPVTTQPVADDISNLANMILAAEKRADKLRKEENDAFDEGKKAVQARYAPLISDTKSIKGKTVLAREACKKALEPFLIAKEAAIAAAAAEARKKADEAAQAARDAVAAADRANLAEKAKMEVAIQEAAIAERVAIKTEKQTAVASGGIGRGIGLRTEHVATLSDFREAATHYYKTRPAEFEAWMLDMAKADIARGIREIPGFTITENKKVA